MKKIIKTLVIACAVLLSLAIGTVSVYANEEVA